MVLEIEFELRSDTEGCGNHNYISNGMKSYSSEKTKVNLISRLNRVEG